MAKPRHRLCHVVLGLVLHCNTLSIDKRITEGLIANRVQVAVLERFIQQQVCTGILYGSIDCI